MVEKDTKKVGCSFQENIAYLERVLPVKESFDIVRRDMEIGERAATFYFIDGFTKDESMLKIMDSLFSAKAEDMPEDGTTFARRHIPYVEVDLVQSFDEVFRNLLSGATCLFIEGYEVCFVIDCRTYPARSVDEPDKDKSLRGSRDGFVETIVFNTALLRRRIRDANLVMERIEELQIDDLKMNQQTLAEAMFKRKWFNPFPKFKFTERPDTAAACLLEGKIVILVDNSPSAMILPTSIYDMVEEANDYYFPTITRVYLKFSRALITFGTVFLTPVYLLFMQNLEWLPEMFRFTVVQEPVYVPLIFQFLLLELSIDGLRLAAMNTPSMLSTPLSVIAGLVMGEFAVSSGWFNAEIMLGMAFVAVANYTQPNFELGYALKFMRLMLLILTACFNGTGFAVGCVLVVCFLAFNKTLSGRNYLNVKLN